MKQYLELVRTILDTGTWQENRTGIRTISMPGAMLRFDLQQGFPAVTTKKLAFKSAIGEMVGFLRASTQRGGFSRARLQGLGRQRQRESAVARESVPRRARTISATCTACSGASGRRTRCSTQARATVSADATNRGYQVVTRFEEDGSEQVLLYKAIDQLRQCLDTIIENPTDRRILFHAWNPAKLDEIALPACHLLYQFIPNVAKREISLCLYIRSNDVGLGTPFNLTEGAALLHLVGRLTGYAPRWFTYFIGDAHIYENQLDMLNEQLKREPFASPQLILSDRVPDYATTGRYEPEWLEKIEPSDFALEGYRHHEALKAPMAV